MANEHLCRPCRPSYVLAMELNEEGAMCIEQRQFKQATQIFLEALKLSEEDAQEVICSCKFCSLDECVKVNRQLPKPPQQILIRTLHSTSHGGDSSSQPQQQQHQQLPRSDNRVAGYDVTTEEIVDDNEEEEGGFVYRKPIRMSPKSIHEGHAPGITLSLIIVFNLGLAHHLNGYYKQRRQRRRKQQRKNSIYNEKNTDYERDDEKRHVVSYERYLQKALQLYEWAYQLLLDEFETVSLQFLLIMANNLGQIHKAMNNQKRYRMCLKQALSTMMVLLDCDDTICNNTNNNAISTITITTTTTDRSSTSDTSSSLLDGFLCNVLQLILKDTVAAAA